MAEVAEPASLWEGASHTPLAGWRGGPWCERWAPRAPRRAQHADPAARPASGGWAENGRGRGGGCTAEQGAGEGAPSGPCDQAPV